jgi:hypothetical protein
MVYSIWREHHDDRNQDDGKDNAVALEEEISGEQHTVVMRRVTQMTAAEAIREEYTSYKER